MKRYQDKNPTTLLQIWVRNHLYRYTSFLGANTREFRFKTQTAGGTFPDLVRWKSEPFAPLEQLLDAFTSLGDYN